MASYEYWSALYTHHYIDNNTCSSRDSCGLSTDKTWSLHRLGELLCATRHSQEITVLRNAARLITARLSKNCVSQQLKASRSQATWFCHAVCLAHVSVSALDVHDLPDISQPLIYLLRLSLWSPRLTSNATVTFELIRNVQGLLQMLRLHLNLYGMSKAYFKCYGYIWTYTECPRLTSNPTVTFELIRNVQGFLLLIGEVSATWSAWRIPTAVFSAS
jgi:hypothetical protein